MRNRRVLITGGAGFIGSNLANELAGENEVIALDSLYLGTPDNLGESVEFVEKDVLDDDLPTDVDVVFHLSALSSYAMHEDDTQEGARVNVEGFVNVVEQARRDDCDTFVYASTSSVYGSRKEPTPEDTPAVARTGYEASKLARERYAEFFSNRHGVSVAGMRLFSVYGGYGSAERHKGRYANVVAQFADDIAGGRSPVLYGDGEQTRDFVYVSDVVRALSLAAEHRLDGVYNVGTGTGRSFNEVVEAVSTEMGVDPGAEYVENPIPDEVYVHDTCADCSKLHGKTGWKPKVRFDRGISMVCSEYVRKGRAR